MSDKLAERYHEMRTAAFEQFKEGQCKTDPLIDVPDDARRGITLVARPVDACKSEIAQFQNKLKDIEPDQYYYPASDLHLTILSIISCRDHFRMQSISPSRYADVIRMCLGSCIDIRLQGITASKSGILIQGFPKNEELEMLRKKLRDEFNLSPLDHSIDERYKLSTAHLTIMRFRKPITNADKLIEILDSHRKVSFGKMNVNRLHLVYNDWYQSAEKVKELDTFALR